MERNAQAEPTSFTLTNEQGTNAVVRDNLTVTPNAVSKKYGQRDPELTYTASDLVNGESLAGENVGSYLITQNTLINENNPNYAIAFDDGNFLTIEPENVPLTVTVDPASQKAGKTVTVTIPGQNAETCLMLSGWDQPGGDVTVTVGSEPIFMGKSGETWLGTWTIPMVTQTETKTVAAEIAATSNYTASAVALDNDGYAYYCQATNLCGTAAARYSPARARARRPAPFRPYPSGEVRRAAVLRMQSESSDMCGGFGSLARFPGALKVPKRPEGVSKYKDCAPSAQNADICEEGKCVLSEKIAAGELFRQAERPAPMGEPGAVRIRHKCRPEKPERSRWP